VSFHLDWLDLREPADHAARDAGLLDAAAAWAGGVPAPLIIDLGCGTGSTVRAFGARAPADARWLLVDADPALLAVAAARTGEAGQVLRADVRALDALPLANARLVTASALLDLVSRQWAESLAERLAGAGTGFYAALSYDGRMRWHPAHPSDAATVAAFNADQRRDKGFGPALGPEAPAMLAGALARRGYRIATTDSAWRIGPEHAALQRGLVEGITEATGAAEWGQARLAATTSAACVVGHTDLLATPPGSSAQSNTTSVSSP
jgi:SAM-dependent methyltransferase